MNNNFQEEQEASEAKAKIYKQVFTFVIVFSLVAIGLYFIHKYGNTGLLYKIPVIKDFMRK